MSSADVVTVLASIAAIQRNIIDPVSSGSIVAYDNAPYTISAANMPLFITLIKPLTRNELRSEGDGFGRDFIDTRSYDMILYHSPYGSGIDEEKIGLLSPWFDLVYTEFGKWPHLNDTDGIIDALIVADSGASVQEYVGQKYYGIRFSLQVKRRTRKLLGKGD